jgi:hypothetical protein
VAVLACDSSWVAAVVIDFGIVAEKPGNSWLLDNRLDCSMGVFVQAVASLRCYDSKNYDCFFINIKNLDKY